MPTAPHADYYKALTDLIALHWKFHQRLITSGLLPVRISTRALVNECKILPQEDFATLFDSAIAHKQQLEKTVRRSTVGDIVVNLPQ